MIYEDEHGFLQWMHVDWLEPEPMDDMDEMLYDPYYLSMGGCAE